MNVKFYRRGFANNSSSSHSIIMVGDEKFEGVNDDQIEEGWFNWQHFICKSRMSKTLYILAAIRGQIVKYNTGIFEDAAKHYLKTVIAKELAHEDDLEYIQECLDGEPMIDHQSSFFFPRNHIDSIFSRKKEDPIDIDMEFVKAFHDYMQENNYVILGGNDNCDADEVSYRGDISKADNVAPDWFVKLFDFMSRNDGATCVKDGESWTLYGKYTGDEFSFSFNGDDTSTSSVPTLVDMKVTDMCTHGCRHCYQGSYREGTHADKDIVRNLVSTLKDIGTGTIAIGGGNPLLHPDIVQICDAVNSNMTACITLNRLDTEKDKATAAKVLEKVDSVAVTINVGDNVFRTLRPFLNIIDGIEYSIRPSLYVQAILEFFKSESQLESFLEKVSECGVRNVTLLGYKQTGRAAETPVEDVSFDWYEVCKNSRLSVGIDADIARRYSEYLLIKNVDKKVLCKEGDRSFYIDAVNIKAHKDSYSNSEGIDVFRTQGVRATKYVIQADAMKEVFNAVRI